MPHDFIERGTFLRECTFKPCPDGIMHWLPDGPCSRGLEVIEHIIEHPLRDCAVSIPVRWIE